MGILTSELLVWTTYLWNRSRNPANITELEGVFKSQDSVMWDTLRAGLLPSKTEMVKTFLFVHAKDGPTTECLIKKLSDNYCSVYRAGEMNFDDDFVSKVKSSLQNRKCMVIYDLENLPVEGITVLKGFCDAYTPIVPKAEFYFALDTGEPPVSKNVNKVAREKLETMWSKKYSHDEFGGTVTRLTQNVLRVVGEDKLPC
uniref:Uncharacterized protein n=1 Tax=Lygus hesperus TaxID=30085 RepID=A0A0A9XKR5_LYGHE